MIAEMTSVVVTNYKTLLLSSLYNGSIGTEKAMKHQVGSLFLTT